MEAASGEFVPVDPEIVRQVGKSIQKLLVVARASDVSTDRVILLGKRQRADERRNQAGGQGSGGNEEICKKLYLRSSFRNIDPRGEKLHRWKSLGGVLGDRSGTTAAVFLFWCTSKKPKRFSKRSRFLFYVLTTDRDDAQRDPFIFAGLLDAVDVRTKDLVLRGKERCGFFPLERRNEQKKEKRNG